MPYLPHGGGNHCRKGTWLRWMGAFIPQPGLPCFLIPPLPPYSPLLTTTFSHPPLSPPLGLPLPKPWDCLFMPGWQYLSESGLRTHSPAYSLYAWVASTHQRVSAEGLDGVMCHAACATRIARGVFVSKHSKWVCSDGYCLSNSVSPVC